MSDNTRRLIGSYQLTEKTAIMVHESRFNGKVGCDVRTWYRKGNDPTEHPGKGIWIGDVDAIPAIIEGLQRYYEAHTTQSKKLSA